MEQSKGIEIPGAAINVNRAIIEMAHMLLEKKMYPGALPYICMDLYNHDLAFVATMLVSGHDVKFSFVLDNRTYYTFFNLTKNMDVAVKPCPEIPSRVIAQAAPPELKAE